MLSIMRGFGRDCEDEPYNREVMRQYGSAPKYIQDKHFLENMEKMLTMDKTY